MLLLTTFIVNLRHMLYSAFRALPAPTPGPWKWFLADPLTDEAYAPTILHYQQGREPGPGQRRAR